MKKWGTKLYYENVTYNINQPYRIRISNRMMNRTHNKTQISFENKVLKKYNELKRENAFDCEEYNFDLWPVLADTISQLGEMAGIRDSKLIEEMEADIFNRKWSNKDEVKRINLLKELKKKMQSIKNSQRTQELHKPYQCTWKPHDVYYHKIENPPKGKEKYKDWYIMVYVIGESKHTFNFTRMYDCVPDVYLLMLKEKPMKVEDIEKATIICANNHENGVFEYRRTIAENLSMGIPISFEYLGKYDNFKSPPNEYIRKDIYIITLWVLLEKEAIHGYEVEQYCRSKNLNQ